MIDMAAVFRISRLLIVTFSLCASICVLCLVYIEKGQFMKLDFPLTHSELNRSQLAPLNKTITDIEAQDQTTNILLLTYFRGGSTFLGESFNRNHEAFYWFEPLHAYHFGIKPENLSICEDIYSCYPGQKRPLPSEFIDDMINALANIYSCDLEKLDKVILTHFFITQWKKSMKLGPYGECLLAHSETAENITDKALKQCLPLAIESCKASPIRVIKTIRVGLSLLPKLRDVIPGLQVIYYVRDPRGMLLSRANLLKDKQDVFMASSSRELCYKMHDDFIHFEMYEQLMPKVTSLIKYEHLATRPYEVLTSMYRNHSLVLHDEVIDWFKENTNAGEDNGSLGTSRVNSTSTAYKWRTSLQASIIDKINAECSQVLWDFGFPT